jgi:REP-associated tyrosine transposase
MSRIGRFVVPDLPHHVTQRGNRREKVFFGDEDYALYRDLMAEACRREGVAVWAYCLMPNHVHLILTPRTPEGLGRALGKAHRRYSAFVNARMRVTGHLFQARFSSVVMDEDHLMAAARYVALNPVRAKLVATPEDWPWSSVGAHLAGRATGWSRSRLCSSAAAGASPISSPRSLIRQKSPRCAPPTRSAARWARGPSSTASRR